MRTSVDNHRMFGGSMWAADKDGASSSLRASFDKDGALGGSLRPTVEKGAGSRMSVDKHMPHSSLRGTMPVDRSLQTVPLPVDRSLQTVPLPVDRSLQTSIDNFQVAMFRQNVSPTAERHLARSMTPVPTSCPC